MLWGRCANVTHDIRRVIRIVVKYAIDLFMSIINQKSYKNNTLIRENCRTLEKMYPGCNFMWPDCIFWGRE